MISFFGDTKIRIWVLCYMCNLTLLMHGQIQFTHYNVEDGLPHDFTFKVYQDSQDYLWIGTDGGLAKFNGNTFKVFDRTDGFASNFIIAINNYGDDQLAIASWKGGLHFMKGDSIIVPDIIKDKSDFNKIQSVYPLGKDVIASFRHISILYEWQKNFKFKKHVLRVIRNEEKIFFLKENIKKEDTVVINTTKLINDTLYFFGGIESSEKSVKLQGVYQYISKEKIIPVFPFLKDKYIEEMGSYGNNLFYATEIDSFFVYNKNGIISRKKYAFNDGIIHKYAKTSYCEVFGVKDRLSGDDIIYLYDKENNSWTELSEKYKLGSGILVSDVFVDSDENIWITSKADGLYKLAKDYNNISYVIKSNNHIIDIIIGNDGKVFFLTLNNIYGFDYNTKKTQIKFISGNAVRFYRVKEAQEKISILYKYKADENFSFLGNGFCRLDLKEFKEKADDHTHAISFNEVSFSYVDSSGISQNINVQNIKKKATINDVEKVKDEIWVATDFGIMIYDLPSQQYMRTISSEKKGSRSYAKKIIKQSDTKIWSVMSEKLVYIENGKRITYYSEEDGLASDKINDIMLDHRGVLWIATQKGFSILEKEMFYNFNKRDGLRSSFVSRIVEDENCQVWIAGNKGAVAFDNSQAFKSLTPPKFIIQQFQDRFELDVIDYSGKETITQYKTKAGTPWKKLNGSILDISNYGVSDYQLQFRVRNRLSNWYYSQKYPFKIIPVWYERTAFVIISSITVLLLITSLIYIRLQRVTERNRKLEKAIEQANTLEKELSTVRENVAQDFHDELGNKLAGISILSDLMMNREQEKRTKYFNMILQVQKDAKDLYFGIKDFIWSIDSKSDRLEGLIVYLSDFGEELFANTKIVFKIEKDLDQVNLILPYYWSRQLLFMFKEILTNALKHSEASEVTLMFILKKNRLLITCSDNGLGFDLSAVKRKNGLYNIQKRAEKLKGELIISDNSGTNISFAGKIS